MIGRAFSGVALAIGLFLFAHAVRAEPPQWAAANTICKDRDSAARMLYAFKKEDKLETMLELRALLLEGFCYEPRQPIPVRLIEAHTSPTRVEDLFLQVWEADYNGRTVFVLFLVDGPKI